MSHNSPPLTFSVNSIASKPENEFILPLAEYAKVFLKYFEGYTHKEIAGTPQKGQTAGKDQFPDFQKAFYTYHKKKPDQIMAATSKALKEHNYNKKVRLLSLQGVILKKETPAAHRQNKCNQGSMRIAFAP